MSERLYFVSADGQLRCWDGRRIRLAGATAADCQRCGAPIGYLGRLWQWLRVPVHRCDQSPKLRPPTP